MREIRAITCLLFAALSTTGMKAQQTNPPAVLALDPTTADREVSASNRPKFPAEKAPGSPKVTCQGDQMRIEAENSTMASVLTAIRACIGVEIDLPEGASESRVYFELGPGPVRTVLDSLLGSTDFNYVIQSSNAGPSPDKIQAIVVMARSKDTTDPTRTAIAANLTMTPARRAWIASRNSGRAGAPQPVEGEAGSVEPEPVEAVIPEKMGETPSDSKVAAGTQVSSESKDSPKDTSIDPANQAADNASKAAAEDPATAAVAPQDPNQDSPAAKELQNKINEMQQLFEQRKKMITNPASTPNQN
jgi:hypothetical protein